ncbi:hypothetical protein NG895_12030 [Aeoliella sp. ICT_H6.2]|uniref:Uncharacterized protein n=1 Tax=Aeoliella straminimaris TaxID=2954799 RepID=A0A9X2JGE0_9BACT|nr:hypothetical protein [Aeoliella straminimaris]MCO6044636.1 hypothetical protein [Aeoliella straminimaris]
MRKDTPSRPTRQKVLVLVHHNDRGPWLEVFGPDDIDVRIQATPTTWTAQGEQVAEDLTRERLPWCYRDLMDTKPRTSAVVREVRPSDVVSRYHALQLLRGLDAVEKHLTQGRARRAS